MKWIERGRDLRVSAFGWCAVSDDSDVDNVQTKCGMVVWCAGEFKNGRPTCEECLTRLAVK